MAQEAKGYLQEKKQFLSENSKAEEGVIKAATSAVRKAEKAYVNALRKVKLPTFTIEVCEVETSNEEKEVYTKTKKDVIIGKSTYNMHTTKTAASLGANLLSDSKLENIPLYVTPAKLFYDDNVELKDLNGNIIPPNTENVYVPLDMSDTYWRWEAYHSLNIEKEIAETEKTIVSNVRIKEFDTLQDYAKYTGVNIILSRGMNGIEKAGIAALATLDEFFEKVFSTAKEMNANISVVTKYYNLGKTLSSKTWNSAMLGNKDESFEYDLSIGDRIIETVKSVGFGKQFMKERYLIDAFTKLHNHKPLYEEERLGIEKSLEILSELKEEDIKKIQLITENKVDDIYGFLVRKIKAESPTMEAA